MLGQDEILKWKTGAKAARAELGEKTQNRKQHAPNKGLVSGVIRAKHLDLSPFDGVSSLHRFEGMLIQMPFASMSYSRMRQANAGQSVALSLASVNAV